MKRLLAAMILALAAIVISGSAGLAQPQPEFKLGFKLLADQIPEIIGTPLEDEHWGANGDSLQQTTAGLMVWRKADNWTAFTNGYRTWANGPVGVQDRANNERFDWEAPVPRPTPPPPPTPTRMPTLAPAQSGWDAAAEQAALEMINRSRAQNGLAALAMDEPLRRVARAHAQDMSARGYFAHISPDGKSPFDRMAAAGIAFSVAAENLGYGLGYGDSTAVVRLSHEGMMAETPPNDGHRRNILNPTLRKVGIGVYRGADGKVYYVSDFTG